MSDDFLDLVFVYDREEPPDVEAIRPELTFKKSGSSSVRNGDMAGTLFYRKPEQEETAPEIPDRPFLGYRFQESRFKRAEDSSFTQSYDDRLEALFEIARDVYFAGEDRPVFGYGLQSAVKEAIATLDAPPPIDTISIERDHINYVVWLNVFSPRLVGTYGRERLLSAPVWRAEEWEDGSILLVNDDDPLGLHYVTDFNEHLGLEDPGL